jgi:AraC-like DNA-binding protein
MTVETFPTYEVDPPGPTAVPPRSRLYRLAPIGIGTPLVESLTSYLTRLAHAHGVTVESLAAAEIAPLVNKSAKAAQAKFSVDSRNLNGLETWTTLTLAALARLTLRHDLAFLTMQPWGQVLSRQNLLRRQLAWCPACFRQWQQAGQMLYIPLLWTLKPEALCPQHQQPLCDHCPYPDCGRQLRLINSRVRPGYCPYCRRWLGLTAGASPENNAPPTEVDRSWLTDQLARLLAATPTLAAQTDQALFARNFKRCVAASAPGSVQGLAQELGISASSFFGWIHRGHPPQLAVLARVCHHLDVSMLAMLTTQPGQVDDPLPPEASEPTLPKITVEPEMLQQRLARLLADPQTRPGSAAQVGQRLGVTPAIIKCRCPEQYHQILQRNRQHQQAQRQVRQEKLARDLQTILDSDESPPPSMFEVARRLGLNPRTARADCPELCRAISHKRQTFFESRAVQVEARLREILAADEQPPPSINQVAARLGENINYLYRKFPTFCHAVTQRYRCYQPPSTADCSPKTTPPPLQAQDHAQLRSQFSALIVAEATPPLSLAEISRRLGCDIRLLQQKYPDLCQQLRQQWAAYRRQRTSRLADRLQHILDRNEVPPPPVRVVAEQLGLDLFTLKRLLPEQYGEVVRRHQADRQAERHRRQAYLEQTIAEDPVQFPSLSQVAAHLGCSPSTLQRQFPEQSQLIIARYRAYRAQERTIARAALEAALSDTQRPPLLPYQVARQLGYENKRYLQTYFPHLCHQLFQRYEAYRRQVARRQLERVIAEPGPEPATLVAISRQLGYHLNSLKYLCPDLCQIIEERYQTYHQHKKQAAKATLEAILNGERAPLSVSAVGREFGYSLRMIQCYFPELSRAVTARYKVYVRERAEQRRRQLDEEVTHITQMLFAQGIDPKLHRVLLRLASPSAAKAPHVRQAWQAARKALGLPT